MPLSSSVKTVTKYVADFFEEVDRSFANGWQWKDALNFADEVFAGPAAAKDMPEAWRVIKAGLSDADRAELIEYIKIEFDIPHEDAEVKAEAIVVWILQTEQVARLFIKKKV